MKQQPTMRGLFSFPQRSRRAAESNAGIRRNLYVFSGTTPDILTIMNSAGKVIHSDPQILGGTPVFVGTRVPLQNLMDYLEAGDSIDRFLEHFPSVSREQAIAALEMAKELLERHARAA